MRVYFILASVYRIYVSSWLPYSYTSAPIGNTLATKNQCIHRYMVCSCIFKHHTVKVFLGSFNLLRVVWVAHMYRGVIFVFVWIEYFHALKLLPQPGIRTFWCYEMKIEGSEKTKNHYEFNLGLLAWPASVLPWTAYSNKMTTAPPTSLLCTCSENERLKSVLRNCILQK